MAPEAPQKQIWPAGMAGRPKMGQNNEESKNNYMEIGRYMENQLKCMELYIKPIKMDGKCIFECFVINRCLGDLERAEINFFALFFYLLVVCKINFIY